ncbi:hypothetical protein PG997_014193 [Apiospora hydei]|uniref:Transmembrane protein n=1 Tax=Apiospora hydei TaxID=1337664 RepID=A0ABR1UT34_9PEZI
MSEVPDGQLVGSMAIVATVALVLTGLALTTNGISRKLPSLSETALNRSYLAKSSRKREGQVAAPDNSGDHAADVGPGRQRTIWYIRFWLMYVLVEMPAHRVALAYNAMNQDRWTLMTGVSIVPALALLPYCLFVWLVRVIGYNTMDLTRRVWENLKSRLPDTQDTGANLFHGPLASILNPDSDSMRPFKAKDAGKRDRRSSQTRAALKQPKLNVMEGGEAPTEA